MAGSFVIDHFERPGLVLFEAVDFDVEGEAVDNDVLALSGGDQIWFVFDNRQRFGDIVFLTMPPALVRSIGRRLMRRIPWKKVVDLALHVALDDSFERGGQPSVGIDTVHSAGLDERGDNGPVLGSRVVASEESVLAVQGDRSDGAFDGVVVDLDAPSLA